MTTERAKERKDFAALLTLYSLCSAIWAGSPHISGTVLVKYFYTLKTNQEEDNDYNSNEWHDNLCNSHDSSTCNYSTCLVMLPLIITHVHQT